MKLDPRHVLAHNGRASALLLLGRHAEALASLDRAAELKPRSAALHVRRAVVLAKLGLHAESREAQERAKNLVCARGLA